MTAALRRLKTWTGRWIGPAGVIGAALFLLARLAVEPLRSLPQFDEWGMEAYSAVETFNLKKQPQSFEVGLFGSSVAVWGLLPEVMAGPMGSPPEQIRKLCVQGGTSFDMRNLIREHPQRFEEMKIAVVEINPRELHFGLERDERMKFDLWQHAPLQERLLLKDKHDRKLEVAEWLLPLGSVRRPLGAIVLNVLDPDAGTPIAPNIDTRLRPFGDWHVADPSSAVFRVRQGGSAQDVARRIALRWRPSVLLDHCLREFIALLEARGVTVILHEMPVHPAVVKELDGNREFHSGLDAFEAYLSTLGIPAARIIRTRSISDIGIPEHGMRDHTHLNEIGARIYSEHLGRKVAGILSAATSAR